MKSAEKLTTGRFGIKKQCVEFARRWLYQQRRLIFADVKIAAHIWDKIDCYTDESGVHQYPVKNIENGSPALPQFGDLLIYREEYLGTGHVAVIVGVEKHAALIRVHEQNFADQFQVPYQRRSIFLDINQNSNWLQDEYCLGWKRLRNR